MLPANRASIYELFAGGGTLGFALLSGMSREIDCAIIGGNELSPRYLSRWSALHPQASTFGGSIGQFHTAELSMPAEGVRILAAGIPCTGASLAGRAKNRLGRAEDHQDVGHLFLSTMHHVRRHRPHVVVFENVPAYQKTMSARAIRDALAMSGYTFSEYVFEANRDFETPARRSRWTLVASRIGDFHWAYEPKPFSGTIAEFVDPESDEDAVFTEEQCAAHEAYCARKRAEGCGWTRVVVERHDRTVPTIVRTYHKTHASGPFLRCKDRYRKFKAREIARLNGFPESFPLPETETEAVEICGQGVSFRPFENLGRAIGKWLRTGESSKAVLPDGQMALF
jgi:Site-specific DNA methylase